MEYQGFKIKIRLAGMEGYEATIVDANGGACGRVYSRESEAGAVAEARTFIDKKLA
jgi:predicted NAD/FAD-dependent oxidoreductase